MTDQRINSGDNIRYICPQMKVFRVSTRTHILQASIGGTPGINDYENGSESNFGFGDND